MSKRENNRSASVAIVILSIVIVILLSVIFFLLPRSGTTAAESGTEVVKNDGRISVPGYESLELKANSQQQSVALPNPPQNNCLFEISLYLADGTLLWQSESVAPGEQSRAIVLNRPLAPGVYEGACLHYDCYRTDESHTRLNSAETLLTLLVY